MTPSDVKDHFGSGYRFNKETGMSHSNLRNWFKWGGIPFYTQLKIQFLTKGALIAEQDHDPKRMPRAY
jgi:hypothetical protein